MDLSVQPISASANSRFPAVLCQDTARPSAIGLLLVLPCLPPFVLSSHRTGQLLIWPSTVQDTWYALSGTLLRLPRRRAEVSWVIYCDAQKRLRVNNVCVPRDESTGLMKSKRWHFLRL